jgi:hypothetical protein
MSDEVSEPGGDTQAFRAFVQREPDQAPAPAADLRSVMPFVVVGAIVLVVVVTVILIIALG